MILSHNPASSFQVMKVRKKGSYAGKSRAGQEGDDIPEGVRFYYTSETLSLQGSGDFKNLQWRHYS